MKTRFIIALVMLAMSLTACTVGYKTEINILNSLTDSLESITAKESEPKELAQKLNKYWIKNKVTLSALLKHGDVDNLDIYINEIVYKIKNGDSEYLAITDEAVHYIDEMIRGEKLSSANIF